MRTRLVPLLLLLLAALLVPVVANAAPGEITRFPLPAESEPQGITAGPDGNLWIAERGSDKIGRLTPSGELTEFAVPTPEAQPFQITAGPDGNVWFTESHSGNVGRITPSGEITEFPTCGYCRPWGIVAGPEGDIWVALAETGELARITPLGVVTRIPLRAGEPRQIAFGPEGDIWVAAQTLVREEPLSGVILKVTPSGEVTKFPVSMITENFRPVGIAAGPDGAFWFVGSAVGIGRIDTSGAIEQFSLPLFGERVAITAGPDGNLWFSNSGPGEADGSIDRFTPSGHLSTYASPFGAKGIAVGPEGDIWFTEWAEHGVGRIAPGAAGLEIVSPQVRIRKGRARFQLFCSGGAPGTRCEGTMLLRGHVKVERGGKIERRQIKLSSVRYSLADNHGRFLSLPTIGKRLRRIPPGRGSRIEALARGSVGVGTRRVLPWEVLPKRPA